MADRIGVMYLGKLVEIGPANEVYRTPAHPYTEGLLDAVPVATRSRAGQGASRVTGELPSAINPPPAAASAPAARGPSSSAPRSSRRAPFGPHGHLAACHFPLQPVLTEQASTTATAP